MNVDGECFDFGGRGEEGLDETQRDVSVDGQGLQFGQKVVRAKHVDASEEVPVVEGDAQTLQLPTPSAQLFNKVNVNTNHLGVLENQSCQPGERRGKK